MLDQSLLPRMRADTSRFIALAPVQLELSINDMVDDGTGGRKRTPNGARAPQVFTLLEPGGSNYGPKLSQAEGTYTTYDFMLLGEWDAAIGLYDEFEYMGRTYRVENILPNNGYEVRAMVLSTGASS